MYCSDCDWLRKNIVLKSEAPVVKFYGQNVHPCNRYPQNILRHPSEPACGEFKPLDTSQKAGPYNDCHRLPCSME